MNSLNIIKKFKIYCEQNRNEENIKKYSRYFKSGFTGYGLTTPQMRGLVKEYKADKSINLTNLIECARVLVAGKNYEEPAFIMLLTNEFRKEFTKSTFIEMENWYSLGINNWAHADIMGMFILPYFLQKNIVSVTDFRSWIGSKNSFQRRSVPVTFIKELKRISDFSELFKITEPLMTDPAREVNQGQGWFLREAWKRQPEFTEEFLLKWKDKAPRLIFQYACEKMDKEYRKKFARSKNRKQ